MNSRFNWYNMSFQESLIYAGTIVGISCILEVVFVYLFKNNFPIQSEFRAGEASARTSFLIHKILLLIGFIFYAMLSHQKL